MIADKVNQRRPKGRHARRKGRPRGTGSKITPEISEEIRASYNRGSEGVAEICKRYGLSENTVRGHIQRNGINAQRAAFKDTLKLSALQHAEKVARDRADVSAWLQNKVLDDMQRVINNLSGQIDFCDTKDTKELIDGYRGAITETRRALGLSEDAGNAGPKTLVSVQCVGEVHVHGPEGSSGMKPLPQMPDLSKLLPPKQ